MEAEHIVYIVLIQSVQDLLPIKRLVDCVANALKLPMAKRCLCHLFPCRDQKHIDFFRSHIEDGMSRSKKLNQLAGIAVFLILK